VSVIRVKTNRLVDKKKTIRKILLLSLWLFVIGGMTTLLVAANRKEKQHVCREVLIGIQGSGDKFYIEKEEILELVEKTYGRSLINRPLKAINLGSLEKALENHTWIRDAELYFDSKDALHIAVHEREPIARVFATNGTSFYIDSSGHKMKLVDQLGARLPVITGYTYVKRMDGKDSAFLSEVKHVSQFIYGNPFWNAQVGQIDITPQKTFELVPVVGDHIIRIGKGENIEQKLNRLMVFYKQVMSKVGFNKYAALDVRYEHQVVAVKKEPASPVDSIQLQKNIEELMKRAALQEVDDNMLPGTNNDTPATNDSIVSPTAVQTNSVSTKTNPNPTVLQRSSSNTARKTTQSQPAENPKQQVRKNDVKPKAVMRRSQ
jgi:cell division protein FtsQ